MRWMLAIGLCACGARTELSSTSAFDASIVEAGSTDVAAGDGAEADAPVQALACPIAPFQNPVLAPNCPPDCGEEGSGKVGKLNFSTSACEEKTLVHEGDFVDILFPCVNLANGSSDTFDAGGRLALAELGAYSSQRFYGDLTTNGTFSACAATTFVGTDGCTWSTTQTITGPVPHKCGGPLGPFEFTYVEKAIVGTTCKQACSATATISSP